MVVLQCCEIGNAWLNGNVARCAIHIESVEIPPFLNILATRMLHISVDGIVELSLVAIDI